jgi:hypothetical protein
VPRLTIVFQKKHDLLKPLGFRLNSGMLWIF